VLGGPGLVVFGALAFAVVVLGHGAVQTHGPEQRRPEGAEPAHRLASWCRRNEWPGGAVGGT
jgi:hypothetical protein